MGLDYRFLLYFHRQDLWEVLQGVARLARPSKLPTLIVFPDHLLSIPLESWGDKNRLVSCEAPEFGLMTSIYFQPDAEIRAYLKRVSPEHWEAMSTESSLGLPVGCIYLTVYQDLTRFSGEKAGPGLALFDFSTPGTTMSLLFAESDSVLSRFRGLLGEFRGVCGVLDREDNGQVIWLNGRQLDRVIPDPALPPGEIEEFLRQNS